MKYTRVVDLYYVRYLTSISKKLKVGRWYVSNK